MRHEDHAQEISLHRDTRNACLTGSGGVPKGNSMVVRVGHLYAVPISVVEGNSRA